MPRRRRPGNNNGGEFAFLYMKLLPEGQAIPAAPGKAIYKGKYKLLFRYMKKTSISLCAAMLALATAATACANNSSSNSTNSSPEFIRTAQSGGFETDFTVAAEKTVNEVVCIKSFTTRQQNPYGNGGYDPFGMFDFFFGPQQPGFGCDHKRRRLYRHQQPCD